MLISSRENPIIKEAAALVSDKKARRQNGLFVVEGARLCSEACKRKKINSSRRQQGRKQKYGGRGYSCGYCRLGKSVFKKVKQAVKKHGTVTGGKDETVSAKPFGVLRIVTHVFEPERKGEVCAAHGHTGVTGFGFLNCFSGEYADGIRSLFCQFAVEHNKTP